MEEEIGREEGREERKTKEEAGREMEEEIRREEEREERETEEKGEI